MHIGGETLKVISVSSSPFCMVSIGMFVIPVKLDGMQSLTVNVDRIDGSSKQGSKDGA